MLAVCYALVDMLPLSKCKQLFGSYCSSFTKGAERIGGLKTKLAGGEFTKARLRDGFWKDSSHANSKGR